MSSLCVVNARFPKGCEKSVLGSTGTEFHGTQNLSNSSGVWMQSILLFALRSSPDPNNSPTEKPLGNPPKLTQPSLHHTQRARKEPSEPTKTRQYFFAKPKVGKTQNCAKKCKSNFQKSKKKQIRRDSKGVPRGTLSKRMTETMCFLCSAHFSSGRRCVKL